MRPPRFFVKSKLCSYGKFSVAVFYIHRKSVQPENILRYRKSYAAALLAAACIVALYKRLPEFCNVTPSMFSQSFVIT